MNRSTSRSLERRCSVIPASESGCSRRTADRSPSDRVQQRCHPRSGVIHAGAYYPPGSWKARLCVQGSREIYAHCDEQGIPTSGGKVVVATSEEELPRLAEIHRRAQANGAPGIELVDVAGLAKLEPHVAGLRALYSPSTGIVDFRRVATALAADVARLGGEVSTNATIAGVDATRGAPRLEASCAGSSIPCPIQPFRSSASTSRSRSPAPASTRIAWQG